MWAFLLYFFNQSNSDFVIKPANGNGYCGVVTNQSQLYGLLKIVSGSAVKYQEVVNKADSYSVSC